MTFDTATITALGTAIATILLALVPLLRAAREPFSSQLAGDDEERLVAALPSTVAPHASGGARRTR